MDSEQTAGVRKAIGSRAQVMHNTAHHTSGGLTKRDLKYNKWGRIVSKKRSTLAKKTRRLEKAGYKATKGTFGVKKVKKGKKGGAEGGEESESDQE
jgi:hypothetical protein